MPSNLSVVASRLVTISRLDTLYIKFRNTPVLSRHVFTGANSHSPVAVSDQKTSNGFAQTLNSYESLLPQIPHGNISHWG